jgi:uncharacterized protein (DUF2147 family)
VRFRLVGGLVLLVGLAAARSGDAEGELATPAGYWMTVDDHTGKPRSIVRIQEVAGELHGTLEKLIDPPGGQPNPNCTKCPGDKRNKPLIGMEILWGNRRIERGWGDGYVLDPEGGQVYHGNLEVLDNGKRLKLFGYVRIIFKIGRSQTWQRVSPRDWGLGEK